MAIKKSQLYSSIWKSCDELRGGMDASQYKDYVLVLLFIKYISDKYAGVAFAPITIPEGSSFKDMILLKGKATIGDDINKKIIAPIAEANKLSEMPDFNNAEKLGSGPDMVKKLSNLIAIFENPALDFSKNRAEGDDILGDTYEYLMRHFATESGKSKGQFYTPAEVSKIVAKVIGISNTIDTSAVSLVKNLKGKELELFKKDLALKNSKLSKALYPSPADTITDSPLVLEDSSHESYEHKVVAYIKDLHTEYKSAKTQKESDRYAKEIYLWTSTLLMFTIDRRDQVTDENIHVATLLKESGIAQDFINWASNARTMRSSHNEIRDRVLKQLENSNDQDLLKVKEAIAKLDLKNTNIRELFIKATWLDLRNRADELIDEKNDISMLEGVKLALDGKIPKEAPKPRAVAVGS